jgi:hypothetical protein
MPRLTASREQVQGECLPEEMYEVRLDGFKPKWSKDRSSVNLNPILRVINHSKFNDKPLFESLNSGAPWIWPDFHHCFGVSCPRDAKGDYEFAGFDGPDDNPEVWMYSGPLLGQTGRVYVIQREYNGRMQNAVKFYVCNFVECKEKHSKNLVKS